MTIPRSSARHAEPPISLDRDTADRLRGLAEVVKDADVADRLDAEATRARIVARDEMPTNVVTIGAHVSYRDEATDDEHHVTLVWPQDADISQGRVSVATPIGAALIGLAEGASIHWETRHNGVRRLKVLTVRQNA